MSESKDQQPDWYGVEILLANPPAKKDQWEYVDIAINEATGLSLRGEFGDGCTADYLLSKDRAVAEKFVAAVREELRTRGRIGRTFRKFKVTSVRMYREILQGNPADFNYRREYV